MKTWFNMEDYVLKTVALKLKTALTSDNLILVELYNELQQIKVQSKGWITDRNGDTPCETILSVNQEQITRFENRLGKTCTETSDIKNLKWLHHEIHKDVGFYCIKNTSTSVPDPCVRTVLDLMSQYEQNCRRKEELENMLNQVHRRMIKCIARRSCTENNDSGSTENMELNLNTPSMQLEACRISNTDPCASTSFAVENHQENRLVQPKKSPKRRPLADLDMNQQTRNSGHQASPKKDPLRRIRSPVLCAYLKKGKQ